MFLIYYFQVILIVEFCSCKL